MEDKDMRLIQYSHILQAIQREIIEKGRCVMTEAKLGRFLDDAVDYSCKVKYPHLASEVE